MKKVLVMPTVMFNVRSYLRIHQVPSAVNSNADFLKAKNLNCPKSKYLDRICLSCMAKSVFAINSDQVPGF